MTDASGNRTKFFYDSLHHVVERDRPTVLPNGAAATEITNYVYDQSARLTRIETLSAVVPTTYQRFRLSARACRRLRFRAIASRRLRPEIL
ncbi:MAG: hypothetical protein HY074_04120 [Deltaproteobacteria bacterium]|nr:hypothetical protein [Deltaproteobacteria bacterium]